ncbi:MAG: glycoside hydrolase family 3 N-terminal domain-containing protein [Gammaproteobacteria bacterium]
MKLRTLLLLIGLAFSPIALGNQISLDDKIGQMIIIGFEGNEVSKNSPIIQMIENDNIGGVILFDYNRKTKQYDKNIESPTQVQHLNQKLQFFTQLANFTHHRPVLPLLISVDYEGGAVNRLKKDADFPDISSAAEIAKLGPTKAKQIAESMALTLSTMGFNLDFAPILDVNTNPDNPIIGKLERSFSSAPDEVTTYGKIFSNMFLHYGVQCAYKHFPGHGSSTTDSHLGYVDVTSSWKPLELKPYQALLNTQHACGMVMTAHIVNKQLDESGLPATLSHKILTGVLRNQLKFQGVIITDDMQMKAISENYSLDKALVLAVNAGADMLIFGNQLSDEPQDPKEIINIIETKVKNGEISQSRIDEAYQHIITLKQSLYN